MTWTQTRTFTLAAPPARVFQALTDAAELGRWFAERVEVGQGPGGPYRFWGRNTLGAPSSSEATQRITGFQAPSALGFTWRLYGVETEVRMALTAEGDLTRVALTHQIEGELPMARPRELIDDHWRLSFGNLAAHLAGDAGVVLPDYTDPRPVVRLTIMIDAAPDVVFRALIEPERIDRWFGSRSAVVEPRVGGRYHLNWKYQVDGVDVTGGPTRILEMVPNRKLVLDWPDWRGDAKVTGQSIAFHLEPAGEGTRVTFIHGGFGRTTDMSDYPFGWLHFLGALRKEAERR